jgi:hypothetical protein
MWFRIKHALWMWRFGNEYEVFLTRTKGNDYDYTNQEGY